MSGVNGDKSRFHRTRKQNIKRRERNRELLKSSGAARGVLAGRTEGAPAAGAKRKGLA